MSEPLGRNVIITQVASPSPKTDDQGRIYREIRCDSCRAWICDEYVRRGRLRLKCFRCGKVILMEFRSRHAIEKVDPEKTNEGNNLNGK